jgi:hypothetical protein
MGTQSTPRGGRIGPIWDDVSLAALTDLHGFGRFMFLAVLHLGSGHPPQRGAGCSRKIGGEVRRGTGDGAGQVEVSDRRFGLCVLAVPSHGPRPGGAGQTALRITGIDRREVAC